MKNKFLIVAVVLAAGCGNKEKFIKSSGGMEYKVVSYKQADFVRPGETLKMHIKQVYEDSVLSDTRDSIPFYQVYDSTSMTPDSYAIFGQVRVGDSVIFKALSDSAFKNNWPSFAKKGRYLYTHVKIVDIFGVKQDFREDLKKEMEKKGGNRRKN